jgi:P27 family predicted phage terminase small subunit
MRGRKPKPIEQRIQEGNPGRRPLPQPVQLDRKNLEEMREPPEALDPAAKEFWRFAVDRLIEADVLDRVDAPALEMLATAYARVGHARDAIKKYGHFTRGSNGQVKEHPAVKLERESVALFLKLAEQYALTPVARTRLGLAQLQGRSMLNEMNDRLGEPELEPA